MIAPGAGYAEDKIAALRGSLFAGRGPGASAVEVLAHTRYVRWLGDRPVSRELERVQQQTTMARIGGTYSSFGLLHRVGRAMSVVARTAPIGIAVVLLTRSATHKR